MLLPACAAIASRTYVLYNLRPDASLYDVKATQQYQVYGGAEQDARAGEIVTATEKLILTYHKRPVLTLFHSTCGGETVPSAWVFQGDPVQDSG